MDGCIEVVIEMLEITSQISTVATNVINIMVPNMADTSKDEMLWAEEYAPSQLRRGITRTVN